MFIRETTKLGTYTRTSKRGIVSHIPNRAKIAHLTCDNCGTGFSKQIQKEIDRERCNNNVSHFCSRCPTAKLAALKGHEVQRENRKLKLGERTLTENGYVRLYVGEEYISDRKYCNSIFEHTYVMERKLKRTLNADEVVHHIDGKRDNNECTNLDVMTQQEHNKCHGHAANALLFQLFADGIIEYDNTSKKYIKVSTQR